MMKINLICGLILLYISGNLLSAEEYFVQNATEGGDCTSAKPCSIDTAYELCTDYDIINIDKDIDQGERPFEISKSITIKSKTDGIYVGILIKKFPSFPDGEDCADYGVFAIEGENSCIFKYFKFTIAQDEDTPAFPIFSLSSGYLRIEYCQFVRSQLVITDEIQEEDKNLTCELIDCDKNSAVNLINCVFENLNSSTGFIEAGQIACYNCSFKNLIMEEGSVINAGEGVMDILDCTFENCVSDRTDGGAINAGPSERLIIGGYKSVTKFSGCKANDTKKEDYPHYPYEKNVNIDLGYGGALYLMLLDIDNLNISNVEFDDENPNIASTKANCMFVETDKIQKIWTKDNVPFMKDISSSSEDFLYHYNKDSFYKLYSLKKLYNGEDNDGPSKLYVSDGGSNSRDCSSSGEACHTLDHAQSLVHEHDIDITFSANYSLNVTNDDGISNKDYNVDIRSGDDDVWIIVNGGSLSVKCTDASFKGLKFYVMSFSRTVLDFSGNNVDFDSITFLPRADDLSQSSGYLHADGEEVSASNCNFKNLNYSSGSAVSLSGSSVEVSDCKFEYCVNCYNIYSEGKGGGLKVSSEIKECNYYDRLPELCSIKGCTFIGCAAKYGGGIYLEISDETRKVSVEDCKFENNSLTDSEGKGYDLYVECHNLFRYVTKGNFPILKGVKEDNECAYGMYSDNYVNLVNFVNEYKRIDNCYFGDNGNDSNTCIDQNNVCWTLEHYIEYCISAYHNVNIYFVGRYTVNETVVLPWGEHTVTTVDANSNLTISKYYSLVFRNKTTFKNMIITFIENHSGSFIDCQESLIVFNNVTFKPENDTFSLNREIVKAEYDVLLDSCVFDSIKHSGQYVLDVETRYNNINISNCTFKNCINELDEGDGYEGGGLSLMDKSNLDVSNKISVSSCSFDGCVATYGGGLYVGLRRYSNIVISSITFGNGNNIKNDGFGRNIYVESDCFNYVDYKKAFPDLSGVTDGSNLYIAAIDDFVSLIAILNDSLKTGESMYYIGDKGSDDKDCKGSGDGNLCFSFRGLEIKVRFDVCNVTIVGNYSVGLNTGFLIYNVVGSDGSNIIMNTEQREGVIVGSYTFNLDCNISNINVIINDSLGYTPMSVQGGIVTFSSLTFKNGDETSELGKSIITVGGDAHLHINSCSFTNFAGIIDGVAIHASFEQFGSLEISGTEFNNITTTKSKGGAIYCSIGTNTTFIVQKSGGKKTVFKRCGALCDIYHYHIIWAEEGGVEVCEYSQGGAIYLSTSILAKKILMTDVEFGKGEEKNRGSCGYDMLIHGNYLDRIATKSNFNFISSQSSYSEGIYYYGSTDGCDDFHYATTIKELDKLSKSRSSSDDDDGFPWWAILIIVLIVVIIIVVIVVVIIICVCKRKGGSSSSSNEGGGEKEMNETSKEGEGEKA